MSNPDWRNAAEKLTQRIRRSKSAVRVHPADLEAVFHAEIPDGFDMPFSFSHGSSANVHGVDCIADESVRRGTVATHNTV